MDLEFYIDPETGMPHIYRHGVEEYEVADVLDGDYENWHSRRGSREANGKLGPVATSRSFSGQRTNPGESS